MTEEEKRGPFTAYRWARYPGSARVGHPAAGAPMHGVIGAEALLWAAPMFAGPASYADADPIFRLVTDMWN